MPGGMSMPGGWTMSMAWMRMPGQTWVAATLSFLGMWVLMMVAMMLPSLVPMLSRYRRAVGDGAGRLGSLTLIVAAGYFAVWAAFGAVLYPVGIGLAALAMRSDVLARAVPAASGAVVLLAGCVQLTAWKARHLACCRSAPVDALLPADARAAWSHGLRLGGDCSRCCFGFIMALAVAGVMDVGAMAIVAAAITLERVVGRPQPVARAAGVAMVAAGLVAIGRAAVALGA